MEERPSQEPESHGEPEFLYHYTTQEGLLGILKDKCIWATHIRYLNDTSEGKFVLDCLLDEISRNYELPKEWRAFLGTFNEPVTEKCNPVDSSIIEAGLSVAIWATSPTVFVASFSAKGDSLSQWRAYSGESGGYSVAFRTAYLRSIGEEFLMGRDDRFMTSDVLIRCGYYESKTKSSFEREVRDTVASYIAQASSGDRGTAGEMQEHRSSQPIAAAHFLPLCTYIAKLKHAGFSDESEWRLGFYLQPNSIPADLCLRAGSSMLVPYLEIPLGVTGKFSVVGLNEIVVGPCPHPEESRKSVEMLLHQAGFKGVQVKSSQIPYRNW